MNVRIIKEIRPLFPSFALTFCGLMITLILWNHSQEAYWGLVVSAFGCILMGVTTFGDEFGNRTMPLLLSQPFSRKTIWREKMAALAVATGILVVVALICTYQVGQFISPEVRAMVAIVVLFGLGVFCTTPFWTLSVKNIPAAVASTVSIPIMLALIASWIINRVPALNRAAQAAVLLLPQLVYFFICYRAGRAVFLNLQELDTQSREIALPAAMEQALVRPFKSVIPRFTSPWSSLINKELHLQRVNFSLTALFCILVPLEYAAWKLLTWQTGKEIAVGALGATFVIHVILVPLIAGAGCVAEEKNWKIHEWHLTLPPSKLKQWCAKVLVALSSTVVLGIFLPGILIVASDHWRPELIVAALVSIFAACLGIFASSISPNSFRAIILTLILIILGITAAAWGNFIASLASNYLLWHLPSDTYGPFGPPTTIVLAITLSCAVGGWILYLGYLNYRTGPTERGFEWVHVALILVAISVATLIVMLSMARGPVLLQ